MKAIACDPIRSFQFTGLIQRITSNIRESTNGNPINISLRVIMILGILKTQHSQFIQIYTHGIISKARTPRLSATLLNQPYLAWQLLTYMFVLTAAKQKYLNTQIRSQWHQIYGETRGHQQVTSFGIYAFFPQHQLMLIKQTIGDLFFPKHHPTQLN